MRLNAVQKTTSEGFLAQPIKQNQPSEAILRAALFPQLAVVCTLLQLNGPGICGRLHDGPPALVGVLKGLPSSGVSAAPWKGRRPCYTTILDFRGQAAWRFAFQREKIRTAIDLGQQLLPERLE
jgi:hypothetical protein